MAKRIFCKLEKNEKTFNILKKYIQDINDDIDLLSEDFKIQKKELLNNIDHMIEWIDKNAANERLYLNALKNIAGVFIISKLELTWENFCESIDQYNIIYECLIEKIY